MPSLLSTIFGQFGPIPAVMTPPQTQYAEPEVAVDRLVTKGSGERTKLQELECLPAPSPCYIPLKLHVLHPLVLSPGLPKPYTLQILGPVSSTKSQFKRYSSHVTSQCWARSLEVLEFWVKSAGLGVKGVGFGSFRVFLCRRLFERLIGFAVIAMSL